MKAREFCLEVLQKVIYEDAYASLLMRNNKIFSIEDRALISEIVYGTLRNYYLLENLWHNLITSKVRRKTSVILDMSIYQLYFSNKIPDYAIINEAVDLTDKRDKAFVNAILRKLSEETLTLKDNNTLENLSFNTSHPLWILKMWNSHYGFETTKKIALFNQTRSLVYGRINTLKISKRELEQDLKITFLNDISFKYDGILSDSSYFKSGQVLIQDYSSALIPTKLDLKAGLKVLDACASPGTKTQEIAMIMNNKGNVIAHDIYPKRCQLIDDLMLKTGTTIVNTKYLDSTIYNSDYENKFDRILVDAPCSGLGDLRHKPEILIHLKPENIDELNKTQTQLLEVNSHYLKEDGILVYSTCTLNKKENENIVTKFLKNNPNFILESQETIFPYINNSDGFYYACLRKTRM